jgi:hypothetical protein
MRIVGFHTLALTLPLQIVVFNVYALMVQTMSFS